MHRLNKTESAVFLYCRFSLFLKDPFSRVFVPIAHCAKMNHCLLSTMYYCQVEQIERAVHCDAVRYWRVKRERERKRKRDSFSREQTWCPTCVNLPSENYFL